MCSLSDYSFEKGYFKYDQLFLGPQIMKMQYYYLCNIVNKHKF